MRYERSNRPVTLLAGEDPGKETELSAAPEEICVDVTLPASKLGEAAPAPALTSASSLINPWSFKNCNCFARCNCCRSFRDKDLCGEKRRQENVRRQTCYMCIVDFRHILTIARSGVGVFFSSENTEDALS